MHKGHLGFCVVGIVVALAYLALSGGSPGGVGLLVAALACPLAMVLAMRFLMGANTADRPPSHEPARTPSPEREVP